MITNPAGDGSCPITDFSWVVVNQPWPDAKVAQSLVSLLPWGTYAGRQYSQSPSSAPLPDAVVKLDEAQVKKITVDGKPTLPQ